MTEAHGPYAMEQAMLAALPDLLAQRDATTDKRERKELARRIKTARMIIKWCRTRAGYAPPDVRTSAPPKNTSR